MMSSEEQYNNSLAALRNLNATYDELTRGNGQLAKMLNSSQLYEQYAGSSRETRAFVHNFRLNPQKYLQIKVF
jgi:hypothetical protein